ncbi:hypothetical protein FQN60_003819 [Etheostoma spectabile]|uniref:Uncharacterized protein n=1 Tax=Etheostoma spectabile TaxID=54343 RepID=A0A5J5CT02_9PERO|nr:hypothetical protein FQN60_006282 [Etheostoma spectabile]KAA8585125.1 hypothetical protein FQN60_003819 [Etheostoma spectabile]
MSPAGCSHVNGYKVDNWKQNLRVIYQCFVWSGTAETRRRKVLQSDAGWTELSVLSSLHASCHPLYLKLKSIPRQCAGTL